MGRAHQCVTVADIKQNEADNKSIHLYYFLHILHLYFLYIDTFLRWIYITFIL